MQLNLKKMWYEKVRYYRTEKIPYRTVTYGIFAKYEITIRYIFRGI